MNWLQNTIKNIRLSLNYGSIFSINSIIIVLELVIVFVLSNIMLNVIRQDNEGKAEIKEYIGNNIVIYHIDKEEQVEYCTKNGTLLGNGIYFNLFTDKKGVSYHSHLYTKEYLNAVTLPLEKGKWFNELEVKDTNNYDFIVVIPFEHRKDFKVGKVYDLYLRTSNSLSMRKVYVSGILKPYVHTERLVCYDVNNTFPEDVGKYNNDLRYCQLDVFNKNELSSLGILSFHEEYSDMIESTRRDRGFAIILIITLYTIFLCGFIGDRILSIDTYTKTYATMFLCGSTKGKSILVQLMQSIFTLLISAIVSVFLIKYLYKVQFIDLFFHTSAFMGIILITLIIHFFVSLLILSMISKRSPVSIINGRYN